MSSPLRTCVGCRQVCDQDQLVRMVLRQGVVVPDPARRLSGRGAWLHPSRCCLTTAAKRGAFARSFRRSADVSALAQSGWPEAGIGG